MPSVPNVRRYSNPAANAGPGYLGGFGGYGGGFPGGVNPYLAGMGNSSYDAQQRAVLEIARLQGMQNYALPPQLDPVAAKPPKPEPVKAEPEKPKHWATRMVDWD